MNLIQRIETYIDKYVSLADRSYLLPLALWTIGTHAYLNFDAFPYLVITSLTKRSGKTRCSEIVSFLSANARNTSALTGPSLFRTIEKDKPTLIFDEAETLSSEAASVQRSVLNVGYRKGQTVGRVVGSDVQYFETYCPKVFVLIGDVYDTLKDRSIILPMQRAEPKARFLFSVATEEGEELRENISVTVKANLDKITERYKGHKGLSFLTDRDEEIWTPLFVLCQVFCPTRLHELEQAAADMSTEKTADSKRYIKLKDQEGKAVEEEYSEKLLLDLYSLFMDGSRVIATDRAIEALRAIPVAPWRKFRGTGIDGHDLKNMLKRFGVFPTKIREPKVAKGSYGRSIRGYKKQDVERAVKSVK
jgi:hypothetical protein